jgi:hypothetical protein
MRKLNSKGQFIDSTTQTLAVTTLLTIFSLTTVPAFADPVAITKAGTVPATESEAQVQRDQRVAMPQSTLEDAIASVRQKGLMSAYPDGQFHQEQSLTRAELASILVKTFQLNKRQTPNPQPVQLSDIPKDFWATDAIETVVRQGVMTGYRQNRFYPNHPVSRSEAYAIFAQAYGVQQLDDQTVNLTLSQFPDADQVPSWARKAIATSLKNGFVDAQPQGKLRPLQPMTRGDMALALNQYLIRLNEVRP